MVKRVDVVRDSAFSMAIGAAEEGDITGFVAVGERSMILKERAIYETILADAVDPERTNPNIPHSQQKVLGVGSADEIVGRVLLTANAFLDRNYLNDVDCDTAMLLAWEATEDLVAMRELSSALSQEVARQDAKMQRPGRTGFVVPSVSGLDQTAGAFFKEGTIRLSRPWQSPGCSSASRSPIRIPCSSTSQPLVAHCRRSLKT